MATLRQLPDRLIHQIAAGGAVAEPAREAEETGADATSPGGGQDRSNTWRGGVGEGAGSGRGGRGGAGERGPYIRSDSPGNTA